MRAPNGSEMPRLFKPADIEKVALIKLGICEGRLTNEKMIFNRQS
jgi:hypothetical protein